MVADGAENLQALEEAEFWSGGLERACRTEAGAMGRIGPIGPIAMAECLFTNRQGSVSGSSEKRLSNSLTLTETIPRRAVSSWKFPPGNQERIGRPGPGIRNGRRGRPDFPGRRGEKWRRPADNPAGWRRADAASAGAAGQGLLQQTEFAAGRDDDFRDLARARFA